MVPGTGITSNRQSPLLSEWHKNSNGMPKAFDTLPDGTDIEQLFDTLAEWNRFLENHVPYFQEAQP